MFIRLSGLGLATVSKLAELGAHIAVLDLELPTDAKERESSRLKFFTADVSKEEDVSQATRGVISWSQDAKLDIAAIVCCAGYLGSSKVRITHQLSGEYVPETWKY